MGSERPSDEELANLFWGQTRLRQVEPEPALDEPALDAIEPERPPEREDSLGVELGIPPRRPVFGIVMGAAGFVAVVAVLALLIVAFRGHTRGRTTPNEDGHTAASHVPVTGKLNAPLQVGSLTFTVHGIREVAASATEQPAAGLRWVAVDVLVENNAGDGQNLSMWNAFDLLDAQGRTYGPTIIGSVARYADSGDGPLAPGLQIRGEVVFPVAADAQGFTLVITSVDRAETARVPLESSP